jgi:mannose PTS system EIIA component
VIGIVIASHGLLAESLRKAAVTVLGELDFLTSIAVDSVDNAGAIHEKFQLVVNSVSRPGGVLILTDMFGGTPANIGLTLHDIGKVEVLTGVNLPMVIKAAQLSLANRELHQIATEVRESGIHAITVASDMLGARPGGGNGHG